MRDVAIIGQRIKNRSYRQSFAVHYTIMTGDGIAVCCKILLI